MALKKQMCVSHPDRPAIGRCVMTGQSICAECSTRYEGVNYSKQGLRLLQERRASAGRGGPQRLLAAAALVASPLLLLVIYRFYLMALQRVIDLAQWEF